VGFTARTLERWLNACPSGPLTLGEDSGPALSALLGGWSSTVVHALAARPLSVAAATEAVGTLGEDLVGERIAAMDDAGLLEALPARDGGQRYAVTEWLRLAIAPLAAAARIELRHLRDEATPIAPLDIEAAFRLTLPLVTLSEELSASCRLIVPVPGRPPQLAGVSVLVEHGTVTQISPDLELQSESFAAGSPGDWIDTLVDPAAAKLDAGGDSQVLQGLIMGLHERLFGGDETRQAQGAGG
jgi:hypothetical protein